jgi:hypothetical protein
MKNRKLTALHDLAHDIDNGIEILKQKIKTDPESHKREQEMVADWSLMLSAIEEAICGEVIADLKKPFWKKLFRK